MKTVFLAIMLAVPVASADPVLVVFDMQDQRSGLDSRALKKKYGDSPPSELHDMTFEDYKILICSREGWPKPPKSGSGPSTKSFPTQIGPRLPR